MATLHFICGKAGAGKTTLARELGRTVPAVVFVEDEWIQGLGFEIRALQDYVNASAKVRAVMAPLIKDVLRTGSSVVLDFGGSNTVKGRQWVRSLFESAKADHVLHFLDLTDDAALAGIHRRNVEKPAGVYFGDVSDELFYAVNPHFTPPTADEGFNVKRVGRG